jgi:hypothetical protein
MGLAKNENFLKVCTEDDYSVEPDFDRHYLIDREHLLYKGMVACHALFSAVQQSDYATRAQRYMSRAIDKAAEGFVERD